MGTLHTPAGPTAGAVPLGRGGMRQAVPTGLFEIMVHGEDTGQAVPVGQGRAVPEEMVLCHGVEPAAP